MDRGLKRLTQHRLLMPGLLILVATLCASCSSRTQVESDLGIKDAPPWVNQGTQAVSDQQGRLIQGVGLAPPVGDLALQRATADSRARAEIAKVLSTYVEATLDAYSQSQGPASDASVRQVLQTSSRVALAGSRILAHWRDTQTGDLYAFAELDLKEVDATLERTEALHEDLRRYLREQGPQRFDRFARENGGQP
ncbi:hypothetical protein [Motiliproteus sp. SC1-56]|uniref:hypothetical protein n=1 Tax=Motiliproteus sp. SC1-56 TaxID=2799565 RepID=UPI001A8BF9FC|nr:hypothetical protein [Motiliproteus sp. SC1-56]